MCGRRQTVCRSEREPRTSRSAVPGAFWRTADLLCLFLSVCACLPCRCGQDDKGGSKGFGFINFKDAEAAAKCVDALNEKEMGGKTLYAGRAQKKTEREAMLRQK